MYKSGSKQVLPDPMKSLTRVVAEKSEHYNLDKFNRVPKLVLNYEDTGLKTGKLQN